MKLQEIPAHPKPKVGLEQYTTPAIIASDLVWNAFSLEDVTSVLVSEVCTHFQDGSHQHPIDLLLPSNTPLAYEMFLM